MAIKVELLIREQTRSTNYKRYKRVDNKTPSDSIKAPLVVPDIVETTNVGIGKGKSVAVE